MQITINNFTSASILFKRFIWRIYRMFVKIQLVWNFVFEQSRGRWSRSTSNVKTPPFAQFTVFTPFKYYPIKPVSWYIKQLITN
jgi:hypothetical protein